MRILRKYLMIARVSFRNAVAYRANVLSGLCFYTVFIYVFFCLWRAIYREGSVSGYTYEQIVWYLIMTELKVFAVRYTVYSDMNNDVKSGTIAYLIGRPVHYVFYQLANAIGQILLNLVCFGALAAVLGLAFVGPLPGFRFSSLPPLLISMALGIALNFFLLMTLGLSAFVMEENFSLFLIYQKLVFMLGLFLPVEFLPEPLQTIAKLLPFSYVSWAPAKLFVSFSWPLFRELIPRQLGWAAASICLTLLCYRGGVKKLQINGG